MWPALAIWVWEGRTSGARATQRLLRPLSWLYARVIAHRNAGFDRDTRAHAADPADPSLEKSAPPSTHARDRGRRIGASVLPAVSIGNLSVGGTGKTPLAAWFVTQLRQRGAQPAIVMRGVGDDEWRVHGLLNPGTAVVVGADRVAGMITARTRGADCVVLDDAFQHRRAPRVVDIVLISADRWTGTVQLLPAGPFREPLSALRRADLVVVTAKAATAADIESVFRAVAAAVPGLPMAVARLVPGALRLAVSLPSGQREPQTRTPRQRNQAPGAHGAAPRSDLLTHPASWLSGRSIGTLCAIADPAAFEQQLQQLGATLVVTQRFADHHAFTAADAEAIAAAASAASVEGVICTLKDAVKLSGLWPRAAVPLWYLSQTIDVARGAEVLSRACDRVLAARRTTVSTAGAAGSNPSA